MPLKRRKAFIEIAKQRAKKMVFGISADGFDEEVISKLEEDNLIYRDHRTSTLNLPHDVLEDWALEEFIDEKYIRNRHEHKKEPQYGEEEDLVSASFFKCIH